MDYIYEFDTMDHFSAKQIFKNEFEIGLKDNNVMHLHNLCSQYFKHYDKRAAQEKDTEGSFLAMIYFLIMKEYMAGKTDLIRQFDSIDAMKEHYYRIKYAMLRIRYGVCEDTWHDFISYAKLKNVSAEIMLGIIKYLKEIFHNPEFYKIMAELFSKNGLSEIGRIFLNESLELNPSARKQTHDYDNKPANPKKFRFIICVNDDRLFNECKSYIKALWNLDDHTVEICPQYGAASMTEGYNSGMHGSDADYNIYLHQDVFIINKNLLRDVIELFSEDDSIGMIGAAGCERLPKNCIWWKGDVLYGFLAEIRETYVSYRQLGNAFTEKYKEVEAVDGIMMITSKNIPWRDKLFTGWHFYDVSQCFEFKKAGYKIIVPFQEHSWYLHDCGYATSSTDYDKYRIIFRKEYM